MSTLVLCAACRHDPCRCECPAGGNHQWREHELDDHEIPTGHTHRRGWTCDQCGTARTGTHR